LTARRNSKGRPKEGPQFETLSSSTEKKINELFVPGGLKAGSSVALTDFSASRKRQTHPLRD